MATKLDKTIKRELELDGKLYTIAISPEGVKMTPKGGRLGQEVSWRELLEGSNNVRSGTGSAGSGQPSSGMSGGIAGTAGGYHS